MPTLIDLGETWYSPAYEVRRATDDALTSNATVTATLTVGATTTPVTPTNTGTGTWSVDYPTAAAGRHSLIVTATGGDLGGGVLKWEDTFTVVAPGSLLVSAADATEHLRARSLITDADDLDQLRWLCLVATDAIARDLGRAVVRETVTEKHSGGRPSIRLRRTPVAAVTTVVENGLTLSAVDGVDWTLDELPGTGLLYRGSPTLPACWAWGRANITVTYVADMASPAPVLRSVALGVVEQLWQASTQVPRSSFDQATVDAAVYATAAALSAPERAAYNSLRAAGIA